MTIEFTNHILPFNKKLFLTVILLFASFVCCFLFYQYKREKEYKIELLDTKLQNYNYQLYDHLKRRDTLSAARMDQFLSEHILPNLRVTIIKKDGTVIYDNTEHDVSKFTNHSGRQEVLKAIRNGSGYDISRLSESVGKVFFYSAHYFPDKEIIIRSALPYDLDLTKHLQADSNYIWFTIIVSCILLLMLYRFTQRLGTSIKQLELFALKADRNEPIDMKQKFPDNELGEISQHIIQIYKRLHRAKEALYIEREKLITHLQISHEGLGVFTADRKELLVNSLFTQYCNIISDNNLTSTEEVFQISELEPIISFLNLNQKSGSTQEEKKTSMSLVKNSRSFTIECIIFQDRSFEISINDVTQEQEQVRLKRQLTQNIAHELKTPVSSIQGYLETIISNPELPRERIEAFIERCYAQSNRLTFLLRDISVLTRMDEAPGMIEMEKANIKTIVENIMSEVAMDLEKRHIRVFNLIQRDLIIDGNASLLYSIFRNLMDNAIAYAGNEVEVTINCFREDECFYYFSFSDNGIGVAPEHLNRLFERFYRVDKGRSRKIGGTGLGLAIVKNAVLIHGGSIFAKNSLSGGLEFVFTLKKKEG